MTLTVSRLDGFREVIQRKTIFLVKTADAQVAAIDSTCTHLGCLVAWDAEAQVFQMPVPWRNLRPQRRREGRSSADAAVENRHAHRR